MNVKEKMKVNRPEGCYVIVPEARAAVMERVAEGRKIQFRRLASARQLMPYASTGTVGDGHVYVFVGMPPPLTNRGFLREVEEVLTSPIPVKKG
jgi:hypothetical protein